MRRADAQYSVRYLGSSADTEIDANYKVLRLKCVKNRIFSDRNRIYSSIELAVYIRMAAKCVEPMHNIVCGIWGARGTRGLMPTTKSYGYNV